VDPASVPQISRRHALSAGQCCDDRARARRGAVKLFNR
jgi:hypothetical protein